MMNKQSPNSDTTVTLSKSTICEIILGEANLDKMNSLGEVSVQGVADEFREILTLLDDFEFLFDIVIP